MSNTDFDPDAFLGSPEPAAPAGGGGFDPDAFLAAPAQPAQPSFAQSMFKNAAQYAPFGLGPIVESLPETYDVAKEVGTAVAESLRGQTEGALKGYGAGYTQLAREQGSALQRPMAPGPDADPAEIAAYRQRRFVRGERMTPETEEARRQQWSEQGARPVTEHPLYQAGEWVGNIGKSSEGTDYLGPGPGWQGSWTRDIAGGATSVLTNIAFSRINPALAPLWYVPGGAGEQLDRALKSGATEEQAIAAAGVGAAAATTNMVDTLLPMFGGSTGKMMAFLSKVGVDKVARIMAGGSAEAIQEGLEGLINNAYAQGTYNPDQDVMENIPRSMAVAFIVGAGTTAAFTGSKDRPAPPVLEGEIIPPTPSPAPPSPMVPREHLKVGDRPIRMLPPDYEPPAKPGGPHESADEAAATLRQFGYPDDLINSMDHDAQMQTADQMRRDYPDGPPGVFGTDAAPEPSWGRASVGAAAAPGGPLEGISKEAVEMAREDLMAAGYTPWTIAQDLEEMSPHQFFGEINDNTRDIMSGLWATPGPQKIEIATTMRQRLRETPERLRAIYDRTFGPAENTHRMRAELQKDKQKAADPFWEEFKRTPIPPTPQLSALAKRLKQSGVWDYAEKQLSIEGVPSQNEFLVTPPQQPGGGFGHIALSQDITTGPNIASTMQYPSAAFYEVMRQGLDNKITKLIESSGHPEEIRRLVILKKAVTDAIDNHRDPRVAGLWKKGRDTSGGFAKQIAAIKFGQRVMTQHVHENELASLTEDFTPEQMHGTIIGIRQWLQDRASTQTGTGMRDINQYLTDRARAKIEFFVGREQADAMFRSLEHEKRMIAAVPDTIGNSRTATRLQAAERYNPPPGKLSKAASFVRHPLRSTIAGGIEYAQGQLDTRANKKYAKIREELGRIYTLQGPERDAVARYLVGGEETEGGPAPTRPPPGTMGTEGGTPPTMQPMARDAIARGRSGRPIQTRPLQIGNEPATLAAGHEKATAAQFPKVPGRDGLFNPLPTPPDVPLKLKRVLSRKYLVGRPNTQAINLGANQFVGRVSLGQWTKRLENTLTPQEISEARVWYDQALDVFEKYFGKDKAAPMLGAWLTANVNATPSFALLSAVQTAEQYVNKTDDASKQKRGGLAHDKLMNYWDSIMSGDLSRLKTEGSGQKIYDFIDSALMKHTRTFYGDDPRAGEPAVADVHSLRDMGFVDQALINWVTEKFGAKAAQRLTRDSEGLSPGEAQYEWVADKMRDFTRQLNKDKYLGGNWTPRQVQAVGWTAMSKMLGRKAETSETAIAPNIRNLSYELDFGAGAPYLEQFPGWNELSGAEKGKVGEAVLPLITDFAKKVTGAHEFARTSGLGGWQQFTSPAFKSRLIASPEVALDVADIIGYLAQQTKIMGYRASPSGNRIGVAVYGPDLKNSETVAKLWGNLVERHPDLAAGFSPSIRPDGVHGIEILMGGGGSRLAARVERELMPALDAIAKELGVAVDITGFKAEEQSREHDWTKDQTGGSYLERLSSRYGPDLSGRLELYKRQELEPALEREIQRLAPDGRVAGRDRGLAEASRGAADARRGQALEGLPQEPLTIGGTSFVPGPVGIVRDAAEAYMQSAGLPYNPPKRFAPVDRARASRIAQAFDSMPHAPNDPRVAAAYDAMINETVAQFKELQKLGVKFEFIKPGHPDPYHETPRLAQLDFERNKHLWVFPTEGGFGNETAAAAEAMKGNPLLRPTDIIIDGKRLVANDVFRIVHDVFGHFKEGVGFRASGEENAWRSHSAMYSDLARAAMTSETRGQNSWVNFGPHGEKNRTAKADETVYAPQKIGLLPDWVINEGADDLGTWWHGSVSGDLRGGKSGLHLGTKRAATQALEARIGIPADGKGWGGDREYGKTLLAGKDTLLKLDPRGYNQTGFNVDVPKQDFYPTKELKYPDGSVVSMSSKPRVEPFKLVGEMSNSRNTAHPDFKANGYMSAQLKRGTAKRGFYYTNQGEDSGSVSIVVPNGDHVERLRASDPLARKVLERGRSGRPIKTEPLAIGSEQDILDAGYKRSVAPPFHSSIAKAVDTIKQEKAPAAQWLGMLKNKSGVKPEEMEWLGLEPWLKEQQGLVTKAQVQEFIRANQIEVKEVVKGDAPQNWVVSSAGGPIARVPGEARFASEAEANAELARRQADLPGSYHNVAQLPRRENLTKFSSHQLPGGENYRELLLTLPPSKLSPEAAGKNLYDNFGRRGGGQTWEQLAPETRQGWTERAVEQGQGLDYNTDKMFRSSHWDELNVLAHIRFNDRKIDGKKTLFIEEIQSDWHQAGKRKGYDSPEARAKDLDELPSNYKVGIGHLNGRDRYEVRQPDGRLIAAHETERGAIVSALNHVNDEARRDRGHQGSPVPDAPLKTTWPELSLKRMIRYAAENGYDKIAWTPGSVQAERYDLSKQIAELYHWREPNGFIGLSAYDHNDRAVFDQHIVAQDKLDDVVGKEMAAKIINGEGGVATDQPEGVKVMSGLDLKVGSEGMFGFYDKILPAAANKLVKKYGVRLGEGKIGPVRNELAAEFGDLIEEGGGTRPPRAPEKPTTVHTLPLTPALRKAALVSGFPQFSSGGAVVYRANGGRVNPSNVDPNPTEAQKQAGNYAKDHISIHGLDITIENAKGQQRKGVDKGGKPWAVTLPAHYGYIKGTVGKDKDHVDVYLGPHQKSPHVFVVDQMNADTKRFDEHKCFIGFASKAQVANTYRKAFSDGRADERLGHMHEMSIGEFKRWLEKGDTTKPIQVDAETAKLPHMAVGYIDPSRIKTERCGNCVMFIMPAHGGPACTLVKSPIAGTAWCRRYSAKGSSK